MAVDLRIRLHPNYLEAVVAGMIKPAEAQQIIAEILKACETHKHPLLLIDWQKSIPTVPMTTLIRFEFVSFLAEQAIYLRARGLLGIRVAFLAAPAHVDPDQFDETVAANRGVPLKVTADLGEALAWLGVEPDDSA